MSGVRWLVSLSGAGATLSSVVAPRQLQSCTFTTTSVAFGVLNVFDPTPLASTGSATYQCIWLAAKNCVLKQGLCTSNEPRQMVNGAARLSYNLYLDAATPQIWGDPNPFSYRRSGFVLFPKRDSDRLRLDPGPARMLPTGSYSDSVVATFNF